jgi:hypothetical protein
MPSNVSKFVLRAASSAIATGALALACSSGVSASAAEQGSLVSDSNGSAGASEQQDDDPAHAPPPAGATEQPPPRPPLCKADADCVDRCPPGSKGCGCHALPDGKSVCVPSCNADADCPKLPAGPPLSCHEGVCTPPPPPPKPAACHADEDCAQSCPPDAKGCSCRAVPKLDKICVPACEADADCPELPGGPPLRCNAGACVPPPPPKPPTR